MTMVRNRRTPPAELERIVFNLGGKGVRHAKLNGRDHLVVNAVMMTEGVHEGSAGPGFYSEAELARSDFSWNHQPIVVYHPDEDGEPVSARTEAVLNTRKIGLVLNTKTKSKKQRFEAWLDYKLTKKVDKRILEAVENGRKVEVSTGIGVKKVKAKGTWGDEKYIWKASGITPDHLAVLPDQVGACSIKDGAGLLQLNAAGKKLPAGTKKSLSRAVKNALKRVGAELVSNEMSFSQQTSAVSEALAAAYGDPGKSWRGYIIDLYPSYVVFCSDYSYSSDSCYYKVSYTVGKDGDVKLSGDKVEVERTVKYEPVTNSVTNEKGKGMKVGIKKKMIAKVVERSGMKKETVAKMDEAELRAVYNATKPKAAPEPKATVVNKTVVKKVKNKLTREQMMELLDPKERAVLNRGIKAAEKLRAGYVETIKKNPKNPFKDEMLNNAELVPDSLLEGIAILAASGAEEDDGDPYLKADMGGASGVANAGKEDDDEEPLVFGKLDAKKTA